MATMGVTVFELNDKKEYQRLIPGAPDSHGMKSGRVYLEAGAECGLHSTHDKEEQLVFMSGKGTAFIGDEKYEIGAGKVMYIPPHTEHNMVYTGDEPLVYVFCVTPV